MRSESPFATNLAALRARSPALAARVAAACPGAEYALAEADGDPVLRVAGVPLQHVLKPRLDGARWASAASERLATVGARRAIVVGLGLAYHVEALAERFGGEITVVEPDPAIIRVALEARDLAALLERVELIDAPAETGRGSRGGGAVRILPYPPALLLPGGLHRRALEHLLGDAKLSGLRLRILVVSPLAGGSLPITGYAARALERLGHEVRYLDLSGFAPTLDLVGRFAERAARRSALEARFCAVLGDGVAAAVEAWCPDLVLALAQAPLDPRALQTIGRHGPLRALWFVEDFRRFPYWREVAPHYDYVFTIQKDECHAALGAVSDAQLAYLPCAFDPTTHRPLALSPEERRAFGSELSFVGAGYRNRRRALVRFLDRELRVWGSDWEGAVDLERVVQRGGARVDAEDAVRIFNATDVNLNLHSSTYHDDVDPSGDFVNPRTFELAGCGAFQVVDRRRLLGELFTEGEEIAVASSVAEMRELALHYLARAEERATLAQRARRRALAEHTYEHRMRALLATVLVRDQERISSRATLTCGEVRRREEELAGLLARLPDDAPFTLERVVRSVVERSGPLAEEEAIFLFLHQFQELYLTEARA